MRGGVKTIRNKDTIAIILDRLISLSNADKLLANGSNKIKSNLNLLLRVIRLNNSTNNGNVCIFLADTVHRGDHHDIDVIFALQLSLGDDDLD